MGLESSGSVRRADAWVPDGGLLLHIGPHKTGTTAIQSAYAAIRPELAALGVVFPGKTPAPHGAVFGRLQMMRGWNDAVPPKSRRPWTILCEETRAAEGVVFVSSEALCHASRNQAAKLCGELREGPARVAITVRPLQKIVPSAWQEYVKAGWTTDYETFLRSVMLDRPALDGPTPTFWQRHDHGRLARRWTSAYGADAVNVVVADPGQPSFVLEAFEDMLGLPRGTTRLGAGPSNRSLSLAESELIRSVNLHVAHSIPWEAFNVLLRMGGIPALVEGRRPTDGEVALVLPDWAAEIAADFGAEATRTIERCGARVLGHLAELAVRPPTGVEMPPTPTSIDAAAVEVFVSGIVDRAASETMRRHGRELDRSALARAFRASMGPRVDIAEAGSAISELVRAAWQQMAPES